MAAIQESFEPKELGLIEGPDESFQLVHTSGADGASNRKELDDELKSSQGGRQ